MDMEEMTAKIRAGEPLYGKSTLDPYHQNLSAAYSRWAQLKFRISPGGSVDVDVFPFFNFANHSQHGVDPRKYWAACPEEEKEMISRVELQTLKGLLKAAKAASEDEPVANIVGEK